MKKQLLFIVTFIISSHLFGQQLPDYSTLKGGTTEQNKARANEAALQAATYLLSVPPDTSNENVKEAASYLVMWMTATKDYSFSLDNVLISIYGDKKELLPVLLAAMVDFEMKNPAKKDETETVRLHAVQTLISYVQNPTNKASMSLTLIKAANAQKKGELDKYLSSLDK